MSLADDINKLSFKDIGVWPTPFKVIAMTLLFALLLLGGYWFFARSPRVTSFYGVVLSGCDPHAGQLRRSWP